MRTDDLIVALARAAGPVQALPSPSARLARWTAGAVFLATFGVIVIGPRADLLTVLGQRAYTGIAVMTLATALASAAAALVLSVPGAERSSLQRVVPLIAGGVWAAALVVLLAAGGNSLGRLLALPVHLACIAEIAGLALLPGWALFTMLRQAAPLQLGWSAALATLAAVGVSAVATQLICPIDDPAHQLVGHFAPAVALVLLGAFAGQRWLEWLKLDRQ